MSYSLFINIVYIGLFRKRVLCVPCGCNYSVLCVEFSFDLFSEPVHEVFLFFKSIGYVNTFLPVGVIITFVTKIFNFGGII